MADYQAIARQKARKYGLDPGVFIRQIRQESGFNPGAVSPAGAIGIAQIMPATARGWGVNPHDPVAALDAAAKNMAGYVRKFGGYRNALVAYNAGPGAVGHSLPGETRNYIRVILGGRDPGKLSRPSSGGGPVSSGGGAGVSDAPGGVPDQGAAQSMLPLLHALQSQSQPRPTATLAAPAFSAAAPMPGGYQPVVSSGGPAPRTDMNALLAAVQTVGGNVPQAGMQPQQQVGAATPEGVTAAAGTSARGAVKITGPNPGRIQPVVRSFMARIAGVAGEPIVGSDGTGHSKYTVNGNISEHFSGQASDIPARGGHLIKLGQDALIAAGMDPRKARQQRGGLFNVPTPAGGRVQIIFNTQEGGDHTDHLHVGVRGRLGHGR